MRNISENINNGNCMKIINKVIDKRRKNLPTIADWQDEVYFDGDYKTKIDTILGSTMLRFEYVKYCFPILSHEFITDLSNFCKGYKNIVEIGCGRGWMSYWLKKYGTELESVDNMKWPTFDDYFDFVIDDDAIEYVKNNNNDLIIMSWPDYQSSFAYDVWENMTEHQTLIYIGEGYGGCTADDKFHTAVQKYEIETTLNENFRSFFAIHDKVFVYKKGLI